MTQPPPLPPSLLDPRPIVGAGTVVALVAAVVALLIGAEGIWAWSFLTGAGLGLVGFAIMHWQRRAARRGSRGAQQGLL